MTIANIDINGHTYTDAMWRADWEGTISAIANDIAAAIAGAALMGGTLYKTLTTHTALTADECENRVFVFSGSLGAPTGVYFDVAFRGLAVVDNNTNQTLVFYLGGSDGTKNVAVPSGSSAMVYVDNLGVYSATGMQMTDTGVSIPGTLAVSSNITTSGSVVATGNLQASGSAIIGAHLNVGGNEDVAGSLVVHGSTFMQNVDVAGGQTVHGNQSVLGALGVTGTLNATGAASIPNLSVTNITVGGTLVVTNPTDPHNITGDLHVSGDVYVGGRRIYNDNGLGGIRFNCTTMSDGPLLADGETAVGFSGRNDVLDINVSLQDQCYWYFTNHTGHVAWCIPGAALFEIQPNGFAWAIYNSVGGRGPYVEVSDIKFKEPDSIQDLGYGLNEILQLRPRSFRRKALIARAVADNVQKYDLGEPRDSELGFVAQEVQAVLPHAVVEFQAGGVHPEDRTPLEPALGVASSVIVTTLVKAVQEMAESAQQLQARVAQLEGQLTRLTP